MQKIDTKTFPAAKLSLKALNIARLRCLRWGALALWLLIALPTFAQVLIFAEVQKDGVAGVDGLSAAISVTVSPDGKHVYTGGFLDNAVAVFSREVSTGQLTFVEVHKDGVAGVDGLRQVISVTVSPDGRHVYAAGQSDDAVAAFSRNASTGQLTFVEVQKDGVAGVDGLNGARSVTVSPDGKHLYVAGPIDDAVAVFSRNASTGQLTFVEVQRDGVAGVDGLDFAFAVTVSPDGQHLYALGLFDDAVAVFSRSASSGQLTFVEVQKDGVAGVDGLDNPSSLTISPDGHHLYTTASGDDAVAVFSRNASTGKLTFVEVQKDGVAGVDGLDGAVAVIVSPNGRHVYAAGQVDDTVVVFSRSASTGQLTFVEIHKDGVAGVDGLDAPTSMTVSRDGQHVYTTGASDNAVAVFKAIKPFVFLAEENVEINGQVNSDGDIHANHTIIFDEGNKPQSVHTGDLTAGDDIIIRKKNRIIGAAMADNHVDNQGAITGGITEHETVTRFPLEDMPGIAHGTNDISVGENKSRTLAPGDYNKIKVAKSGTLRLSSGVYNISRLEMSEKSLLVIDLSSGNPISINADDRVKLLKKVTMKLVPAAAATALITFNVDEDDADGDDKVAIGDESRVFGSFNVPEGTVEIGMKARFKGAVCAENIIVKKGARFVHHSSTAKFPKESEVEESEVAKSEVVTDYVLEQNYPNPFNPTTEISFQLPVASEVKLVIYSVTGQVVRELVNGELPAGRHTISWNGRNRAGEAVAGGVYLYRLIIERNGAAPVVITKKMTFVK